MSHGDARVNDRLGNRDHIEYIIIKSCRRWKSKTKITEYNHKSVQESKTKCIDIHVVFSNDGSSSERIIKESGQTFAWRKGRVSVSLIVISAKITILQWESLMQNHSKRERSRQRSIACQEMNIVQFSWSLIAQFVNNKVCITQEERRLPK